MSVKNRLCMSIILLSLVIPCLFLTLLISPYKSYGQESSKEEKIKELVLNGLNLFFNLEFEKGEKEFDKVIDLDPENPSGYLFKAVGMMNKPFSHETNKDKDLVEPDISIDSLLEKSVEKAKGLMTRGKKDSHNYLMLAVAHALMSVRDLDRNSPIKALREAKKGHKYLLEGLKSDPQNYDLYYGLGILNYYLGNIKGMYGFLISKIFFQGDKSKGINELEIAAKKGLYAKNSARAELFFILVNMERDFEKAIPLGYELVKDFPNNPEFTFLLAFSLSEVKEWGKAIQLTERIREQIEKGKGSFWENLYPRYWHLMGKIYLDKGELEIAREYLEKATPSKEKEFLWIQSLAFARLGMICDLKKQREKALDYYKKSVQAYSDGAGAKLAERYMIEPYSR